MPPILSLILSSRRVRWLAGALAAIAGIWVYGRAREQRGRQRGAEGVARDAAQDTIKRVEEGNEQVADRRGADPADRLRDNDREW
jgi:hypothetical protein